MATMEDVWYICDERLLVRLPQNNHPTSYVTWHGVLRNHERTYTNVARDVYVNACVKSCKDKTRNEDKEKSRNTPIEDNIREK